MIRDRHWWVFLFLLFAVVTTTWLTLTANNKTTHNNKPEEDVLDSFATQVHITNLDKTGHISTQIYTPQLMHYSKNNRTQLQTPAVILHVKDQPDWQITSKKGELRQGTEEVFLENNVIIHQPKGIKNDEMTVQTDNLTVYPEKKLAMTEQPILLFSNNSQISSVGMQADMTKGTLELKSSARGQYALPPP